jgi:hypothetical protein
LIELQNYGCVSLSFIKKMILYAILIATFDRDNCKGFYPFLDVNIYEKNSPFRADWSSSYMQSFSNVMVYPIFRWCSIVW